jgi:hypothetical protein
MHERMLFRGLLLASVVFFNACLSFGQATDLFISEYVEGSSSNKYIEIYNGTGASVNLADYQLRLYSNGAGAPTTTNTLSGTLADNSVIVYKNSGATIYAGAATTASAVNFNGDDAIALYKISTASFVDIFGNIGCDPGTSWTSGAFNTKDKTVIRNSNICSGVTTDPSNSPCSFPTQASEWTQFNQDDVSNLGSHTALCVVGCTISAQPTTNSSAISISNIGCYSMDLSWTSGNGANRIVVASTSAIVGTPTDQIFYTANPSFGLGSSIAAGEFVVYNGNGNSFTVSGLSSSTTYHFAIFEYNGNIANCEENYLTTGVVTGSDVTVLCSCPEITGILVDACGGSIEGINEFFTFENGNSAMPIDSLTAAFPSGGTFCNSGCGGNTWTTNPTYVAQLNTTAGCPGLFVEQDPIPAGGEVIVFTGSSPTYNFDFSGLCSTGPYYAVFANNTTTTGRFANYNATCSNRTLNVDFGSNCTDAVTYDRCLLSNVDGDYVTFDAAGNPTYQNDGCTPSAVLPIELLYFKGEHLINANLVEWTTLTEINNDYFTIEKSFDAISFSAIGIIQGAGNSFNNIEYQFSDDNLTQNTNYYRLKQTDFDGKYSYSNIIVLKGSLTDGIYYNNNNQTLELGDLNGELITIYNLQGQAIKNINSHYGSVRLNLAKGMYLISVQYANETQTKKIVVR